MTYFILPIRINGGTEAPIWFVGHRAKGNANRYYIAYLMKDNEGFVRYDFGRTIHDLKPFKTRREAIQNLKSKVKNLAISENEGGYTSWKVRENANKNNHTTSW